MEKSVVVLATTVCLLTTSHVNAADKIEIKLSGQINRAITFADNGVDSDTLFVDSLSSGTRFRLTGKMNVNPNLSAGVAFETQYQDNGSGSVDIGSPDSDGNKLQSRKREIWFKGNFGKFSLGQGSGAADATSEVDFSGTNYIADYSGNNLDDGISFADSAGNKIVRNNQVFTNFDGLSRNDRLRYDAPAFGPIGISVSTGQDRAELGLRFKKSFGGSKIGAALGYVDVDNPGGAGFDQLGLSASYLAPNGISLTGAYGERSIEGASVDPSGLYIKLGKKFGQHAVSISHHTVDDLNTVGDVAERTNLAYVYNMRNGIELYGMAQNSSLERASGPELGNVKQISIGSRIQF